MRSGSRIRSVVSTELTDDGRSFAAGDIDTAKSIFARQAKARAPLVPAICNNLEATSDGTLSEDFFLDMLRSGFAEDRAHQQLDLAIDWGRYAELYSFDAGTGQLKLDHLPSADASTARQDLDSSLAGPRSARCGHHWTAEPVPLTALEHPRENPIKR